MNAQCRKFTGNISFYFCNTEVGRGCILHGYLAPAILSHISCPSWLLLIMMIPFHKGPGPHSIPQRLQIARRNIQSISLPNSHKSCLYKVVVFINDWWVWTVMFLRGIHNCVIHTQQFSQIPSFYINRALLLNSQNTLVYNFLPAWVMDLYWVVIHWPLIGHNSEYWPLIGRHNNESSCH